MQVDAAKLHEGMVHTVPALKAMATLAGARIGLKEGPALTAFVSAALEAAAATYEGECFALYATPDQVAGLDATCEETGVDFARQVKVAVLVNLGRHAEAQAIIESEMPRGIEEEAK